MTEFCVIIPAVKKNVAFTDDLVKKLAGVSLIQRAIDTARALEPPGGVHVVTDSEEIRVIAERNKVNPVYKKDLLIEERQPLESLRFFLARVARRNAHVIVLHPYTPLLTAGEIGTAYRRFLDSGCDVMLSLREEPHRSFRTRDAGVGELILADEREKLLAEVKAFQILRGDLLVDGRPVSSARMCPYQLGHDVIEIQGYQDWWICEKLLRRRRIVFRVIGNNRVGMGHIFRALSLAHEIVDHEVIFVCDEDSRMAAIKLAAYDYRLEVFPEERMLEGILSLRPQLVVNDILNTDAGYVAGLKQAGVKVVNFEDLGEGAKVADITFNEVYDEPRFDAPNVKWGWRWYFARDEFEGAARHRFRRRVDSLLITFGGTDPENLTFHILDAVQGWCREAGIHIYVVAGEGYLYKDRLADWLAREKLPHVSFTHAVGVMSAIMEKTPIAISANGRTVYELALMNIPAIILSQHARENMHIFSCEENGFINVGIYRRGETENAVLRELKRLVQDEALRRRLFERVKRFNFAGNKARVARMILRLLERP